LSEKVGLMVVHEQIKFIVHSTCTNLLSFIVTL
jgi:hypothetical protein